jgi:membrane associated rhomboid family serine protease
MAVMHQNRKNNILLGQNDNALTWLILINAVVFVGLYFTKFIYRITFDTGNAELIFQNNIQDWLTLPPSLAKLGSRPWTIITHMFVHDSPIGLVGTVLWLWAFGYILQDLAGNNKLIPVYLYSGVASGLLFIIAENMLPALRAQIAETPYFLGGGVPVLAIAVAVASLAPRYRLLPMINGGIPLWILTLIFVIIDFSAVVRTNSAYAAAHIGGGLVGFVFIYELRRGRDWGAWMTGFYNWADDLFNPTKKHAEQTNKQRLFYKATRKPYEKTSAVTQQRVDDLLDKISREGYHFLTEEEKEFLKKASQQDFTA